LKQLSQKLLPSLTPEPLFRVAFLLFICNELFFVRFFSFTFISGENVAVFLEYSNYSWNCFSTNFSDSSQFVHKFFSRD